MSYSKYADQSQAQLMTLLKEKLAANSWKEADELTKILMIKISSCRKNELGSYLYLYLDIDNCPDKEIKEIDRLWLEYSNSYFGFTVQKTIYNRENYQQFITNVGWYKGDSWLSYDDLFYWETALKGHLPYCGWHFWQGVWAPSTSSHSLSNHKHFHQPHYHAPHGHNSGGGLGAGAALGTGLVTFFPPLLAAAVAAGAAYLIHRELTKKEREEKERLEREEQERQKRQKRLEEENKVQNNIGTLLALVN